MTILSYVAAFTLGYAFYKAVGVPAEQILYGPVDNTHLIEYLQSMSGRSRMYNVEWIPSINNAMFYWIERPSIIDLGLYSVTTCGIFASTVVGFNLTGGAFSSLNPAFASVFSIIYGGVYAYAAVKGLNSFTSLMHFNPTGLLNTSINLLDVEATIANAALAPLDCYDSDFDFGSDTSSQLIEYSPTSTQSAPELGEYDDSVVTVQQGRSRSATI